MNNTRVRGLMILGGIIVFAFLCVSLSFSWMPGWGIGIALPVIEVPGEVVVEGGLFGINLTNTFIATLFADFMVLSFAFLAWRASKGWTQQVPKSRWQGLAEVVVGGLYNFCKGIAGDKLHRIRWLWPLVGTIFIFLLAANLMKLFPGVESVGKMHCAYPGFNGYSMVQGATSTSYLLYVDQPLDAGTPQTEEGEAVCLEYFKGWKKQYPAGFPIQTAEEIEATVEEYEANITRLGNVSAEELNEDTAKEIEKQEIYLAVAPARIASLEAAAELDEQIAVIDEEIAALQALKDGGHSEDAAAAEDHSEGDAAATATEEPAAEGEGEAAAEGETAAAVEAETELTAEEIDSQIAALEDQRADLVTERNLQGAQARFPGATLPLTDAQMDRGAVPYIFHITPFFRGPATDLSLTFALAIMSVVVVQVAGVISLGPAYFEKFVNITALGNLGKKPMGAIDFIVGLIEIISEIGKIVSLAFRLFGNLFAGGVALLAISFLVAAIVPGIIYGLELIIGTVQALVFCVLTLVFATQAMESHHGDDHDHDEHHEGAEAHH